MKDNPNPPRSEPYRIEYRRWRNKSRDYEVEVMGVHHSHGEHGWYASVTVLGDDGRTVTWPGGTFLRTFESLGRKLKIKSSWERL